MATLKSLPPAQVNNLTITIGLPVGKPVMGTCVTRTTSEWKAFFTDLAHGTNDILLKKEYEHCHVAIKWADSCNGLLETVKNRYGNGSACIELLFKFESFDDVAYFVRHLNAKMV